MRPGCRLHLRLCGRSRKRRVRASKGCDGCEERSVVMVWVPAGSADGVDTGRVQDADLGHGDSIRNGSDQSTDTAAPSHFAFPSVTRFRAPPRDGQPTGHQPGREQLRRLAPQMARIPSQNRICRTSPELCTRPPGAPGTEAQPATSSTQVTPKQSVSMPKPADHADAANSSTR